MSEKIKIAYITKNLLTNGISTVVMNYCKNFDMNKFEITIFAGNPIDENYRKECEKLNIKIIELPPKKKNPIGYFGTLLRKINKANFDIVHIHGNSATITVELLISKIKGIPVRIAHCHNSTCDSIVIHKTLRPVFNKLCNYRFACSELAGKWMFNNKQFKFIPNGFEIEKFKYNEETRKKLREEYNLTDKYVIGHVGRFNNQKNHPYLLKIFEKVAEKDKNAVLYLVGTGPDLEKIQNLINCHPFKDRIIYNGVNNNVSDVYDLIDIFVFPSKFEGLGIVLLEAQIKGLKCVCSDVVPNEAVISQNIKMLHLDENCDKWVEEILDKSNINRSVFYEENYSQIKKFDIKENANDLMEIYENTLK